MQINYKIKERIDKMNFGSFKTYRQTDILTADPKRLVLMCYEGIIQNLDMAKQYYLKDDFEAKGRAIQRSLDIVNALREALNFEQGGEISRNLDRIYTFAIRHILRGDIKRNIIAFDEIIAIFRELKSAWEEAFFNRSLNKDYLDNNSKKEINRPNIENVL